MALLGKVRLSISTVSIILLRFTTNIKTTLKIEFQRNILPHLAKIIKNFSKFLEVWIYQSMISREYQLPKTSFHTIKKSSNLMSSRHLFVHSVCNSYSETSFRLCTPYYKRIVAWYALLITVLFLLNI